ncbi:phytoene/squalene synthase family protein [Pollutibacter soli]|uniref:phytoene/squalene synthase family protein n=1 Tax=Pollutibacter soli TaxID=3034157 RepID=UPI003013E16B
MSFRLFAETCEQCSRITTKRYSTSFSGAILLLHKDIRQHVYNIYGFVRFADEIVDTFHDHNKADLLSNFKTDTFKAIDAHVSLNPILQSFQNTVHAFNISNDLIEAFFKSMEWDLEKKVYDEAGFREYIFGSAEVVGLMCLHIFCGGKTCLYEKLKPHAQSLGAAFQKVNFLRDIKSDQEYLSRLYFPGINFNTFSAHDKQRIENEIAADFRHAYEGIMQLPANSRFGVYLAYKYYLSLFRKICNSKASSVLQKRIRIPNYAKAWVATKVLIRTQLNIL